jgi:uncharacterized protein (DUF58 family)
VPARERQTFPLVPRRRRVVGLPFGDLPSRRRGAGGDVIGTRPYEAGDPVSTIDWFATARLSAAVGRDEFVVRDRSADEAPRVVLVSDRRPAMGVFPPSLPWLEKPRAVVEAATSIATSAAAARSDVASLDLAGDAGPYWLPPGRRDRVWLVAERLGDETPFDAPEDNVEQALTFLAGVRSDLPPGTFVFVLSDFLVSPADAGWVEAVAHGWDVVPVVIRDPVWEQSFPQVGGVGVPIMDPRSGHVSLVRLTRREAARRRDANEERQRRLLAEHAALGLDPVVLGTSEPDAIDRAFVAWAELRKQRRWAR